MVNSCILSMTQYGTERFASFEAFSAAFNSDLRDLLISFPVSFRMIRRSMASAETSATVLLSVVESRLRRDAGGEGGGGCGTILAPPKREAKGLPIRGVDEGGACGRTPGRGGKGGFEECDRGGRGRDDVWDETPNLG